MRQNQYQQNSPQNWRGSDHQMAKEPQQDPYSPTFKNSTQKNMYFPSPNDLQLGVQGYQSRSENNVSDPRSHTDAGADTYVGHMTASQYEDDAAPYKSGSQVNSEKKTHASKAYGMENGNWIGMEASFQDTMVHEQTSDRKNEVNNPLRQQSPLQAAKKHDADAELQMSNFSKDPQFQQNQVTNVRKPSTFAPQNQHRQKSPAVGNRMAHDRIQRLSGDAPFRTAMGPPPPVQHRQGSAATPSNMIFQTYQQNQRQKVGDRFGDQSTIMEDTQLFMNQTQNKTLYQVTQTHNIDGGDGPHQDYFKQVNSPRKELQSEKNARRSADHAYNLQLRIYHKTEFGESLQVVGSIEELGSWKTYKCPMKWTEGHYWITENLQISSKSFFTYKYVIMKQNKAIKWEKGPNRIADLEILPDKHKLQQLQEVRGASPRSQGSRFSALQSQNTALQTSTSSKVKYVELRDEWEHFSIRFSIYSSSLEDDGAEFMRIIGSIPELTRSGSVESGPLKLKRSKRKFRWLNDKYGQELRPWECNLKFKIDVLEKFNEIIYSYSKTGKNKKEFIYEREPSRIMEIQKPQTYRGELGLQKSSQWRNWDKVWIVNGHIEKADGNFLGELFCSKIGDSGLCIGTYPSKEEDVQRLQQAGITGVLNLMNVNDFRQRGFPWRKLEKYYQKRGINSVRFAVNDVKEKDLQSNLFIAAQHLNNMVNNQGLNVFVHCTSGISRAPAVVIAYLCLYKKVKCWQSSEDVAHFVKAFNNNIFPNMRVIKKCIETNRDFQKTQQDQQMSTQQKTLGDTIEDSFYFPNMVSQEETKQYSLSPVKRYSTISSHKSELDPEKQIIPNLVDTPTKSLYQQFRPSPRFFGQSPPKIEDETQQLPLEDQIQRFDLGRVKVIMRPPEFDLYGDDTQQSVKIEETQEEPFASLLLSKTILEPIQETIQEPEVRQIVEEKNPAHDEEQIQKRVEEQVARQVAEIERRIAEQQAAKIQQELDKGFEMKLQQTVEMQMKQHIEKVQQLDQQLRHKEVQLSEIENKKSEDLHALQQKLLKEKEELSLQQERLMAIQQQKDKDEAEEQEKKRKLEEEQSIQQELHKKLQEQSLALELERSQLKLRFFELEEKEERERKLRLDVDQQLQLMKQKELEQQRQIENERHERELRDAEIAKVQREKVQLELEQRQMLEQMQKQQKESSEQLKREMEQKIEQIVLDLQQKQRGQEEEKQQRKAQEEIERQQKVVEEEKQRQQVLLELKQKELEKLQQELVEEQDRARLISEQEATEDLLAREETPQENILQSLYDEDAYNTLADADESIIRERDSAIPSPFIPPEENVYSQVQGKKRASSPTRRNRASRRSAASQDTSKPGIEQERSPSPINRTRQSMLEEAEDSAQREKLAQIQERMQLKQLREKEQQRLDKLLLMQATGEKMEEMVDAQVEDLLFQIGQEVIKEQQNEARKVNMQKIALDKKKSLGLISEVVSPMQFKEQAAHQTTTNSNSNILVSTVNDSTLTAQPQLTQTDTELLRLQNLRKVEEEKLRLIKVAQQVQEQQIILQQKELEQHETSQRMIKSIDNQKSIEESESLILDYTGETFATPKSRKEYKPYSTAEPGSQIKVLEQMLEDMDHDQFEQKCGEFFKDTPIKFRAQKGQKIQEVMQRCIKKHKITVPVIHIRGNLFLIGTTRCSCDLQSDTIVIRAGGGGNTQKIEQYIKENQKEQQIQLISHMIKSQQELDRVCDKLIKGIKIRESPSTGFQGSLLNSQLNATINESAISPKKKVPWTIMGKPSMAKETKLSLLPLEFNDHSRNQKPNTTMAANSTNISAFSKGIGRGTGFKGVKKATLNTQQPDDQINSRGGAPFVTPLKNIDISHQVQKGRSSPTNPKQQQLQQIQYQQQPLASPQPKRSSTKITPYNNRKPSDDPYGKNKQFLTKQHNPQQQQQMKNVWSNDYNILNEPPKIIKNEKQEHFLFKKQLISNYSINTVHEMSEEQSSIMGNRVNSENGDEDNQINSDAYE